MGQGSNLQSNGLNHLSRETTCGRCALNDLIKLIIGYDYKALYISSFIILEYSKACNLNAMAITREVMEVQEGRLDIVYCCCVLLYAHCSTLLLCVLSVWR